MDRLCPPVNISAHYIFESI